ncbi:MAG: hypothetical protein IKD46_01610 [Lentisphaeria bacterium]|nr:hypothetical protein [Lentisphaeria bacterium]
MKHFAALAAKYEAPLISGMKQSLDRLHVFLPIWAKKMVGIERFELSTF